MLENKRGITLLALIVTVIIMVIIAGAAISIILSNNGLLNRTQQAVKEYKAVQKIEQEQVDYLSTVINRYTNKITDLTGTTWKFKSEINYENDDIYYNVYGTVSNGTYEYYVNGLGIQTFESPLDSQIYYFVSWYYPISSHTNYNVYECFYYFPENILGFPTKWVWADPTDYMLSGNPADIDINKFHSIDQPPTFTIEGGSDVTNSDLIDWFYDNAILQN